MSSSPTSALPLRFSLNYLLRGVAGCAIFSAAFFSADFLAGPILVAILGVFFSATIVTIVFAKGRIRAFAIGALPGALLGEAATLTQLVTSVFSSNSGLGGTLQVVVESAVGLRAAALFSIGIAVISGVVAVLIHRSIERANSSGVDDRE